MEIYVLMLCGQIVNGIARDDGFDVFGLYSTMEKAEEAKEWITREDGLYQGCRDELLYDKCCILTRIVDCNLPK